MAVESMDGAQWAHLNIPVQCHEGRMAALPMPDISLTDAVRVPRGTVIFRELNGEAATPESPDKGHGLRSQLG